MSNDNVNHEDSAEVLLSKLQRLVGDSVDVHDEALKTYVSIVNATINGNQTVIVDNAGRVLKRIKPTGAESVKQFFDEFLG